MEFRRLFGNVFAVPDHCLKLSKLDNFNSAVVLKKTMSVPQLGINFDDEIFAFCSLKLQSSLQYVLLF